MASPFENLCSPALSLIHQNKISSGKLFYYFARWKNSRIIPCTGIVNTIAVYINKVASSLVANSNLYFSLKMDFYFQANILYSPEFYHRNLHHLSKIINMKQYFFFFNLEKSVPIRTMLMVIF